MGEGVDQEIRDHVDEDITLPKVEKVVDQVDLRLEQFSYPVPMEGHVTFCALAVTNGVTILTAAQT